MTERTERFDPRTYEAGWRERWAADDLYRADDDDPRDKHYLLTMLPYTSGDLHIGHWYAATGPDIVARMRRMQGLNVMFPMGFDSFGLPAENAAIDRGEHPWKWTEQNVERMRTQFRSMGCMFDWSREVVTSDPSYYRWTQWLFLQFFKAGLAYRAMAPVDWCPKDQVVLAREQVEGADRHCWRCGTPVIKRDLEQWFFRTTRYADELLDFSKIDWPEPIRLMQTNWIGRSEGAEVDFAVEADGVEPIRVFTTRPDTIFGATFMVLAPEHSAVAGLTADDRRGEVEAYVATARRETEIERLGTDRERTGVFIGAHAVNPMTEERIPIWIADYVLPGYGTGAVMGVPAHDDRDYAFARRYDLPVRYVIMPRGGEVPSDGAFLPHTEDEVLIDSGEFTGMAASDAIPAITEELAERGQGSAAITYRIRDWLVSRQRYWGAPIPIVYCDEHGAQPLPEDQLPVLLPRDVDFAPTGVSPLQSHAQFLSASCPVCAGPARRETDTLDTFVDSAWYFLRYCSPARGDAGLGPGRRHALDAGRPVHRRCRARGAAPDVLALLRQGAARHAPAGLRRAIHRAAQPGADPGRRPPPHEQVPRQRRQPRRPDLALRLGHGALLPDVHRAVGPGRPVESGEHRGGAPLPGARLVGGPGDGRTSSPGSRHGATAEPRRRTARQRRGGAHDPCRHRGREPRVAAGDPSGASRESARTTPSSTSTPRSPS